ncbi:MAG: DUF2335 domain-containing protein [Deltaproteobacteria bacterium]|nr:DUF2335 domain-containing protein [Deltaproteobacteria bacterium]
MTENGNPPGEYPEGESGNDVVAETPERPGEVREAFATILKGAGIRPSKQSLEILSANISFKGPLPHPEILKGYKQVVPDLPNRIVEKWEREGAHRRETETAIVRSINIRSHTGQWMSFLVAIFGLATAAVIALLSDHQWAAAVVGSAALGVPPLVSLLRGRQGD